MPEPLGWRRAHGVLGPPQPIPFPGLDDTDIVITTDRHHPASIRIEDQAAFERGRRAWNRSGGSPSRSVPDPSCRARSIRTDRDRLASHGIVGGECAPEIRGLRRSRSLFPGLTIPLPSVQRCCLRERFTTDQETPLSHRIEDHAGGCTCLRHAPGTDLSPTNLCRSYGSEHQERSQCLAHAHATHGDWPRDTHFQTAPRTWFMRALAYRYWTQT